MTLSSHYHGLASATHPKTDFINEVALKCGVTYTTVRNWIGGHARPSDKSHYGILAEITGIPEDQLFAE